MNQVRIERITEPADDVIDALAALLMDAVASNSGISFMSDLQVKDAAEWWRVTLQNPRNRTVILGAWVGPELVGTVQLQPAWPPNQPHRADVAKLIVHRSAQGRGIARELMRVLEDHARSEKFTLLLLDTCKGSAAEKLYTSLGWIRVGEVPGFAFNPDGSLCDTVFFYKELPTGSVTPHLIQFA